MQKRANYPAQYSGYATPSHAQPNYPPPVDYQHRQVAGDGRISSSTHGSYPSSLPLHLQGRERATPGHQAYSVPRSNSSYEGGIPRVKSSDRPNSNSQPLPQVYNDGTILRVGSNDRSSNGGSNNGSINGRISRIGSRDPEERKSIEQNEIDLAMQLSLVEANCQPQENGSPYNTYFKLSRSPSGGNSISNTPRGMASDREVMSDHKRLIAQGFHQTGDPQRKEDSRIATENEDDYQLALRRSMDKRNQVRLG